MSVLSIQQNKIPNKEAQTPRASADFMPNAIVIGDSIYYSIKYIIWSQLGVLGGGCRAIDPIEENAITENAVHKLIRNLADAKRHENLNPDVVMMKSGEYRL